MSKSFPKGHLYHCYIVADHLMKKMEECGFEVFQSIDIGGRPSEYFSAKFEEALHADLEDLEESLYISRVFRTPLKLSSDDAWTQNGDPERWVLRMNQAQKFRDSLPGSRLITQDSDPAPFARVFGKLHGIEWSVQFGVVGPRAV